MDRTGSELRVVEQILTNRNVRQTADHRARRFGLRFLLGLASLVFLLGAGPGGGNDKAAPQLDFQEMIKAGGTIGYIIIGLSVVMLALIIEHLLTIRRRTLMPRGLAEQTHLLIGQRQFKRAEESCRESSSFLGHVLAAGISQVGMEYADIEKGMEDAATENAARLFRKIEYLSVISTLAPMLGLLGTVWGMILAFMEFELKANPQVSELAPGIYKALITTLQGLSVAIPSVAAFAYFRSRIDELVAESSLLAEHVFADHKRALAARKRSGRKGSAGRQAEGAAQAAGGKSSASPATGRSAGPAGGGINPIVRERERPS